MALKRSRAADGPAPKKTKRVAKEASPAPSNEEEQIDVSESGSEDESEDITPEESVTLDGTAEDADEPKTFAELVSTTFSPS